MTVKIENPDKLVILLSAEEATVYQLDEFVLKRRPFDSNEVLFELMRIACQKSGFIMDDHSMLVNIFPKSDGSYMIYITKSSPTSVYRLKAKVNSDFCSMYEFNDGSDLLDVIAQLYICKNISNIKSCVYTSLTGFRLIIYCKQKKCQAALLASEYATAIYTDKAKIAQTEEHWQPITGLNAIKQIGELIVGK